MISRADRLQPVRRALWTPAGVRRGVTGVVASAVLGPLGTALLLAGPIALMRLAFDHQWLVFLLLFTLMPGIVVVIFEIDSHFDEVAREIERLTPLVQRVVPGPILTVLFWVQVVAELGQMAAFGAWIVTWVSGLWMWALAGVPAVILVNLALEFDVQNGLRLALWLTERHRPDPSDRT